jgi:hypothetical protein
MPFEQPYLRKLNAVVLDWSLMEQRSIKSEPAMAVLDAMDSIVCPMELDNYEGQQTLALPRIALRYVDHWPMCCMSHYF